LAANLAFPQSEKVTDRSHELRINSNGSGPFTWQGGLYYFDEKNPVMTFFRRYMTDTAFTNIYTYDYTSKTRSKAAFAQIGYQIVPGLELQGGIRYTEDKRSQAGY